MENQNVMNPTRQYLSGREKKTCNAFIHTLPYATLHPSDKGVKLTQVISQEARKKYSNSKTMLWQQWKDKSIRIVKFP